MDDDIHNCLCGAKEVNAYLDGGTRVCEKGHVYHFCQPDSTKKYGWLKRCFGGDKVPCEKLPITFESATKPPTKPWDQM